MKFIIISLECASFTSVSELGASASCKPALNISGQKWSLEGRAIEISTHQLIFMVLKNSQTFMNQVFPQGLEVSQP